MSEYPLWMCKGDWDKPDAITVRSEAEEADARDAGFVNGHEFYSTPHVAESDESYEASTALLESPVEVQEISCAKCGDSGKDPSDKRKKCPDCK